jgi:hypothetical protein
MFDLTSLNFYGADEYDAWEYNKNGRVLIVDLHKLLTPVTDEEGGGGTSQCFFYPPFDMWKD